jgi:hypothetical protein
VKRLWMLGRRRDDLEGVLRAHRPSPHPEFLDELAAYLGRHDRRPRAWSRLAFASAVTTVMLGAVASFGGLGYAAGKVDHGVSAVKSALASSGDHAQRVSQRSPAADQYESPPPVTPPGGGGVLGAGGGGGGGQAPQATVSGELPFTGFPLIWTALLGLGFVVLGVLLRRRESRP